MEPSYLTFVGPADDLAFIHIASEDCVLRDRRMLSRNTRRRQFAGQRQGHPVRIRRSLVRCHPRGQAWAKVSCLPRAADTAFTGETLARLLRQKAGTP